MKVDVHDYRTRFEARASRASRGWSGAEWFFLLVGLAAVDAYVWVNTSTILYQAYEDWSFDEILRGSQPSVKKFIAEEAGDVFGWRVKAPPANVPLPKTEPSPTAPLPDALLGRLRIPRLNISAMVREGADGSTLRRAVGHIPGTALPGRDGNVGLAGHRDTFFRALRNIAPNDVIEFETGHGSYQYVVQSTKIVSPRDVGVLAASRGKTMTLVTCYPFYYVGSAPKRFIVRAALVPATSEPENIASRKPASPG